MLNLEGRVAAVFGLANKRSIAWGIAQRLQQAERDLTCDRATLDLEKLRLNQKKEETLHDTPPLGNLKESAPPMKEQLQDARRRAETRSFAAR